MICCLLWFFHPRGASGMVNVLVSIPTFFCFCFFVFCFSHLRGASGMVNVLVSIPRSLWGQETLSLQEYIYVLRKPPIDFYRKGLYLGKDIQIVSKPEPLNNLGEKDEDLELSEPLADAHAGALAEREAHKRMNCLLGEEMHELSSNAGHHTYIFFLGFHPSFWQEHFGVVDELKRRWKHVKLSKSISKFAHLRCRLLSGCPDLKIFPTSGLCCMVIWHRTATVPVGRICPPTSRSCSRTLKEGNQLFSLFSRL